MMINAININNISLEEFLSDKKIYSSQRAAQYPGFEADHLISVCTQMKKFNDEHGTFYTKRKDFEKEVGIPDDRCYRLTPFEHVVAHYLKAKEDPGEIKIFESMVRYNFQKLNENEKNILENLKEFARLREEGTQKIKSSLKGKPYKNKGKTMQEITGNPNYVDPKKGKTLREIIDDPNWVSPNLGRKASLETRKKLSESHKNSERNKIAQAKATAAAAIANKGKKRPKEICEKTSNTKKVYYTIIDPEKNIFYIKGITSFCKATFKSAGSAAVALGSKGYYKNYFAIKGKIPRDLIDVDNMRETLNKFNIFLNPCEIIKPTGEIVEAECLKEFLESEFPDRLSKACQFVRRYCNYNNYIFKPRVLIKNEE